MSGVESCGCCGGLGAQTPERVENPAGQSAITYRIGRHAQFKASLLARLSSAELPSLAGLTTRAADDFTIAFCDGLAVTLDVLAFYQERIANENFLRTATEKRSIQELARLIGYQLSPGSGASTHLAFALQQVPGLPALAAAPITIPVGTKVQSVPGPGEQPQTFETVEATEARADWNAIPVQTSLAWHPQFGDRELWLAGVGHNLQPGDAILIVGQERLADAGSERWDIRMLTAVDENLITQRTRLAWDGPLGSVMPHVEPAGAGASVYVFRQRAPLFGHNAPDPRMMDTKNTALADLVEGSGSGLRWKNYQISGSTIDLDSAYPKIVPGSWFALVSNEEAKRHPSGFSGYVELYRSVGVSFPSRLDFGLSGKVTRLIPDTDENLDTFRSRLQQDLVLAQTEALPVAERQLAYPLYGTTLSLGHLAPGIGADRSVAVAGKRARIRLKKGDGGTVMQLTEGGTVAAKEQDSFRMVAAPEESSGGAWIAVPPEQLVQRFSAGVQLRLLLLDRDGREGRMTIASNRIELVPAFDGDEIVREIAIIADFSPGSPDRDRVSFTLSAALKNCYDRPTATVNANVARATHGETVSEILGSGDARVPNAAFALRQWPLTFVHADTPEGRASTLELRVNDLLWTEVPSLYARGGNERVYEISVDEAKASVRFGDGVEGARLPSGDHNVRAVYRKGIGLGGNVAAGKLTSLLSRPLGVTGVDNPEAASGGEDPEITDKARTNAPLTVLTLDRAVSIRDYQDYARTFAGIEKAHALWIPSGPGRGIFVTVAGAEGAAVPVTGDTFRSLLASLRQYGDALLPLTIASYRDARFRLKLTVKVAGDADSAIVLPAVESALRLAFGFEARSFGQSVSIQEVSAVAQGVSGVEAVSVAELHRVDAPTPVRVPRLFPALPLASVAGTPLPAELLSLDSGPLVLEQMP